MTSKKTSDFDNTPQFDQHCANNFTSNNTNTLSLQNNNTETRDMDPYSVQSAEFPGLVRQPSGFQDKGSLQVDQSNPYNLGQVNVGNVFNKKAAPLEHDKRASTQGSNPPRSSGSISDQPSQENAAAALTNNGYITPRVNKGQGGNIQGGHQASATFSDKSVTSAQNPKSSQGAAGPHLPQDRPTFGQMVAYIRMLSQAKKETEKKARALLVENQQLRTNNQDMRSYIQRQDGAKQQLEQFTRGLFEKNRELENALQTQTDQCNRWRQLANEAHHRLVKVLHGPPSNKELIEAHLGPAQTAPGPNPYGPAAQHSLVSQRGLNPVGATTFVTPAIVSSRSGPSIHQNGQPATPAPHNPLEYVNPGYPRKTYPTPPDGEEPATKPQADTIDLTLDELETIAPMTQIAANPTGNNEAPSSNQHSRDHYIKNDTSTILGGPKKEPPWMHQERVKAQEQSLMQIYADEKSKLNRKAEAGERPGKKAKTQPAVNTTKPGQGKGIKKPRVAAKSKASANAKKHTVQPTADTSLLDREREEEDTRELAAEMEAELTAEAEKEARELEAEIEAELEAGAKVDLNTELNKDKEYKPDAGIDPALLVLDRDLEYQFADKEGQVTVDRPSSPVDSLFDGDDRMSDIEDSGEL